MGNYLGLDTSNYTTSAALFAAHRGYVDHRKAPLAVAQGAVGLRQSDAVFAHVKQLGDVVEQLMGGQRIQLSAIGVSVSPRDVAGSYMPCFLVGKMTGQSLAAALGVPLYTFSHQAGHIAAALYSVGRLDLMDREFVAFHVSGGTTECLLVTPHAERIFSVRQLGATLDLHAGQVVDRVGAMLGLAFPSGPQLEQLAAEWSGSWPQPKPTLKGMDCCLSGVENQCRTRLERGESPQQVAAYCLAYLEQTLLAMVGQVVQAHPQRELVFSGGVMANQLLQQSIAQQYGGLFAKPEFSADNAAGVAVLCARRHAAQ